MAGDGYLPLFNSIKKIHLVLVMSYGFQVLRADNSTGEGCHDEAVSDSYAFDLYKLAFNPLRYPANLLPMTISSPAEHLDEYVGIKLNIADAS